MVDQETRRCQIGKNLAYAREVSGLTQVDVIVKLFGTDNPSKSVISDMESGKRLPDADLLQRICLLYGVSADWILGFTAEVELDPNLGHAGVIYQKVHDLVSETAKSMTMKLCLVGAEHLQTLPKSQIILLVNHVKKLVAELRPHVTRETPYYNEYMEVLASVIECDRLLALQHSQLMKKFDAISESEKCDENENVISAMADKAGTGKWHTPIKSKKESDQQMAHTPDMFSQG